MATYQHKYTGKTYALIKDNGTSWEGLNVDTMEIHETLKPFRGDDGRQWVKTSDNTPSDYYCTSRIEPIF